MDGHPLHHGCLNGSHPWRSQRGDSAQYRQGQFQRAGQRQGEDHVAPGRRDVELLMAYTEIVEATLDDLTPAVHEPPATPCSN